MERQHSRLGFVLFSIYLVLYGGFVLINAFRPEWPESIWRFSMDLVSFCLPLSLP